MRIRQGLFVLSTVVTMGFGVTPFASFAEESDAKPAAATESKHCEKCHDQHAKECGKTCPDCKKGGCEKCHHCKKGDKDCAKCTKCHPHPKGSAGGPPAEHAVKSAASASLVA